VPLGPARRSERRKAVFGRDRAVRRHDLKLFSDNTNVGAVDEAAIDHSCEDDRIMHAIDRISAGGIIKRQRRGKQPGRIDQGIALDPNPRHHGRSGKTAHQKIGNNRTKLDEAASILKARSSSRPGSEAQRSRFAAARVACRLD
jgi:hypothetical protein